MSYIHYDVKNGVEYGSLYKSQRVGGIVTTIYCGSLGRVIDKEKGIFKARGKGIYWFTLTDGTQEAPEQELAAAEASERKHYADWQEHLILDFGETFFLDTHIKRQDFYSCYLGLLPGEDDTLFTALYHRIETDKEARCYIQDWWEGDYASQLFPNAKVGSQSMSRFLRKLGDEKVQRLFFERYLHCLYGENESVGILIDSTGVHNASKMEVTQISNHNGDINLEVRIIYVIDRSNGMPIYFRYISGNIVDVSTLITTMTELKQYRINLSYAIMDAGYFSEDNILKLLESKIPFMTRLVSNRVLYKELAAKYTIGLRTAKYAVKYGERLVYIKKAVIPLYGHETYAYIAIDDDIVRLHHKKTIFHAMEDKLTPEQIDERMAALGLFIIISSEDMAVTEVLPLYYTRQQVEQVFDITKNYADLTPIRTEDESNFRGHLMLTFLATVVMQRLQRDILKRRPTKKSLNGEGIWRKLHIHKCKVYSQAIVPQEAVAKANEVYRLFKIKVPQEISRIGTECK